MAWLRIANRLAGWVLASPHVALGFAQERSLFFFLKPLGGEFLLLDLLDAAEGIGLDPFVFDRPRHVSAQRGQLAVDRGGGGFLFEQARAVGARVVRGELVGREFLAVGLLEPAGKDAQVLDVAGDGVLGAARIGQVFGKVFEGGFAFGHATRLYTIVRAKRRVRV
jgi:hypothetical protein